jgi:predicted amidohydrolase
VRVGACQTPEILGDVDAVQVVHDLAGRADAAGVDLLVFPECFLRGYLVTVQHVHGRACEVASAELAEVLGRLAGVRQLLVLVMIERAGSSYVNAALVISGGRVVGGYRKTFLTGGESVFTAASMS